MKAYGSNQRLCIGTWIFCALCLFAINVFNLFDLEKEPWIGDTPTVRNLRMKIEQFNPNLEKDRLNSEDNLAKVDSPIQVQLVMNPDAGPAEIVKISENDVGLSLPVLTGVVQIVEHTGVPHYRAVLDGQVYEKSDQIRGYSVGEITPEGVKLYHPSGKYFLSNPKPLFSSEEGG
jgi:hypothetical protein